MHVGLSWYLNQVGFLIRLEDPQKLSTKLFDHFSLKSPIKI